MSNNPFDFKNIVFIATIAVTLTLYVHQTFATNKRVDNIEGRIKTQEKLLCLTAIHVGVKSEKLPRICQLE